MGQQDHAITLPPVIKKVALRSFRFSVIGLSAAEGGPGAGEGGGERNDPAGSRAIMIIRSSV